MNIDDSALGIGFVMAMFIFVGIPLLSIGFLVYLVFRSFLKRPEKPVGTVARRTSMAPFVLYGAGAIFVFANFAGSKYSEESRLLDAVLLALPFVLAGVATMNTLPLKHRIICLVLALVAVFVFLVHHYPQYF